MTEILIAVVSILALVLIIIFLYYENNYIDLEEFNDRGPSNERILLISDLHSKLFGKGNAKLLMKIKEAKPTIIVLAGDMIDSKKDDINISLDLMIELVKIGPTFYVSGNHERRSPKDFYYNYLDKVRAAGVNVINDKGMEFNDIYFIGIESKKTKEEAKKIYDSLNKDKFQIVVNHEPEYFKEFCNASIVLSGHAHGGQFRIFKKGIFSPGQGIFPKYTSGLYYNEKSRMYLSRGLGGKDFRIRIFNKPHLILINLKK